MPAALAIPLLLALTAAAPPPQHAPRSGVVTVGRPRGPAALPRPPAGTGDNVRANQDASGRPQNETALAVDPLDPLHVVAGANDYRNGDAMCGWYTSFDGGVTWADGTLPLILNYDAAGDPDVDFDRQGNVFYACLIFQRDNDTPPSGVYVSTSTDGGLTWGAPVAVAVAAATDFEDKEFLAVDRSGGTHDGNLYVSWTRFLANGDSPIFFARSTDGGTSFSTPLEISTVDANQGSMPVVGPNGEVYVFWEDFLTDNHVVDRSLDGGVTFGTDLVVAAVNPVSFPLPGFAFRGNSFPYAAVDTSGGPFDGRIYVAWADQGSDGADILLTWSDDQAATWAAPVLASDGTPGAFEFFPFVTVDERGRLDLMWYTNEHDPVLLDVHVRRSDDGGASWDPSRRVTSVSSDPFLDGFNGGFIGDYNHMAAAANALYPFWTDTRNGEADVFAARGELSLLPSSPAISSASPAPLELALDGGPLLAGRSYAVLGSATGTSPGTPAGSVVIPLVQDAFTAITLNRANTPPLASFQGLLDARGRATATFAPPPGRLSSLVGSTLWFAWVTHSAGVPDTTSHAAGVAVLP